MGSSPDVRVRLSAEGELQVLNAFKRIQSQAEQTGKVGARGLGALTSAASTLGRFLPALSFGAVIAGAVTLAKRTLETADNFAKLSQRFGVSVEDLSGYAHGADLAGISTEDLATGLGKLAKAANAAAQGGEEAKRPFHDLGIEFKNSQGGLRPLDALLGDVADKFALMPDGPRKAALAMELFGRSGAQLIPFLNQGRTGLEEMRKEAERLGLVFDTKTALAVEAFNDNLRRLRGTVQGFVNEELVALLPQLSEFIVKLGLLNLELKEWKLRLESAGLAAVGAVEALIPFHGDEARGFFAMATDAAEEAALVEIQWNVELSKSLGLLAKLGQQPKKTGTEPPITDEAARGKALDAAKRLNDAQLALTRTQLDSELALVKANIATSSATEGEAFKDGLRALEVFFGNRRAMLEFESKKEIEILEKQAAAIQERIGQVVMQPLKKGQPEAERQSELLKLRSEFEKTMTEIEVRRVVLTGEQAKLAGEERDAVRKASGEQLQAEAQLAEAQGRRFDTERAELDAQIAGMQRLKAVGEDMHAETDAEFAARQQAFREAGELAIQFRELQAEVQAIFGDIETRRVGIEVLVQRGVISELEGQRQIALMEMERLPRLREIAVAMKAAAITEEQIESARKFGDELEKLAASADLAGERMADFKKTLQQVLTDDLANWFSHGIDDAKSFGDAMRSLALSVVQSLREMAAQALATMIFESLFAAIGKLSGGGSVGGTGGGGAIEVAAGGLVRGPGTGTSDSISAQVSTGEFITRAAVVRQPGVLPLLETLNEGNIEEFRRGIESFHTMQIRPLGRVRAYAGGGVVEPDAQTAGRRGRLQAELDLNDVLVLKRLTLSRDFERAVVRTIGNYRKSVKGILR